MRKRILSLILAIIMVLTLIPETAFAANTPYLGFRWAMWNDTTMKHEHAPTSEPIETSLENSYIYHGSPVSFYFVDEDGTETNIKYEDLQSSDTSKVVINKDYEAEGIVHLSYVGYDNASIDYVHTDGKTYSVPVSVILPYLGYYISSAAPDRTAHVNQFGVTDSQNTIYLMVRDGFKLKSVKLTDEFDKIADVALTNDQYENITITGKPENGRMYYDAYCEIEDEWGNLLDWNAGIELFKGSGLKFHHGWYDNNQLVENTNGDFQSKWDTSPDCSALLYVYAYENENSWKVLPQQLTSSNENVVRVEVCPEDSNAVRLAVVGFGNATIEYTDNHTGKVYSMEVVSKLPMIGAYSEKTASQEAYISSFKVTEESETFYLAGIEEWKIEDVILSGDFSDIASCNIAEDGSYATVTVTGIPDNNRWYDCAVLATHPNQGQINTNIGICLYNGKPVDPVYPMFENIQLLPTYEWNVGTTIEYLNEFSQWTSGETVDVTVTGGDKNAVSVEKVTTDYGEIFWSIRGQELGTAELTLTHKDSVDPSQTRTVTFEVQIKKHQIGHGHSMLEGHEQVAFPGEVSKKELHVSYIYYDEVAKEIKEKNISNDPKTVYKWFYGDVLDETAFTTDYEQNNTNVGTISVSDKAKVDQDSIHYGCDITYEVDGEVLYSGFSDTLWVVSEYLSVDGPELSADFYAGKKVDITPEIGIKHYDSNTGNVSFESIDNYGLDIQFVWSCNSNVEAIKLLCEEAEIPFFESVKYDSSAKYYVQCSKDFVETKNWFRMEVYVIDPDTGSADHLGEHLWEVEKEECSHPSDSVKMINKKSATCTKAGYTGDKYCSACDMIIENGSSVKKLGHKYASSYTTDKKATCTTAGSKSKHCSRCDAKTSVTVIPKKGHSYKKVITKATLTKNGKIVNKCTVCDYVASKTTTVYAAKTIKLSTTKYTYNGKVKEPSVTVKDSAGNTLKKDTDYTVTYAIGRKNVGRYAVTIKFKGKYSGEKKLYFYVLPSKTSKITPASTTTTIKASWKKVTGATGYKVELLSSKGKVLQTKYTENLNYIFKGLSKVTTYKVRVTAYKTISKTKYYSLSSTMITTSTAPAAPTSVKVTAGSKKANLSWKKVTCTGYEITYDTNSKFSSPDGKVLVTKSSTVKKTISKLTKGKTYYFKIRSYKTVSGVKVYGSYSKVVKVKMK